jgi:hypothetical protein
VKIGLAVKYLVLVCPNIEFSSRQIVQIENTSCTDNLVVDPAMLSVLDDVRDIRYYTNDEYFLINLVCCLLTAFAKKFLFSFFELYPSCLVYDLWNWLSYEEYRVQLSLDSAVHISSEIQDYVTDRITSVRKYIVICLDRLLILYARNISTL